LAVRNSPEVAGPGVITRTLVLPMLAHVAWVTILYLALTVVRAPSAWGIGRRQDGSNPWSVYEPRISANLRNQFEWPVLFYAVSLLLLLEPNQIHPAHVWLAWLFVAGRILHSGVQILTANIRLRGIVFTINFVAVLAMWGLLL
jgi:hypothetical protein